MEPDFWTPFLVKTVIYNWHTCTPFCLLTIKSCFICVLSSDLRACEGRPFSLMVQAPDSNNLLENQAICLPDAATGMSGSPGSFLCPDDHHSPACVSLKSALWAVWAGRAQLKLLCSGTLHHTQKRRRIIDFTSHRWCWKSLNVMGERCFSLAET